MQYIINSLKALSCTSTHVQTHCSRVLASGRGRDPEEHRLLRTLDAVTRVCTHIPLFLNGTSSCTTGHGTFSHSADGRLSRQIFAPRLVQVMPITGPEVLLQIGTFLGPVPASTCLVLPGITSGGTPPFVHHQVKHRAEQGLSLQGDNGPGHSKPVFCFSL